ncbi:hypothetical protein HU200_066451 [Digitaria exilis]|uniref:Uncharacterized protein n=1 Tax=Digitaria exilis TaxID=1010633 RepID=A0A835A6J5_9POAL|nr:hypothetical protein HU200_066451 [Digitaria exilis]
MGSIQEISGEIAFLEVVVDVSPRAPQGDMGDRRMSDAEFVANIANDFQFGVAMALDDFPDDTFEREVAEVDVDDLSESSSGEEYGGASESEESKSEKESPHANPRSKLVEVYGTTNLLLCVEWHLPNRVMRQFCKAQLLPPLVVSTSQELHNVDRRRRFGEVDWRVKHLNYLQLWEARVRVPLEEGENWNPHGNSTCIGSTPWRGQS